jgi:hypothetical protein
MYPITSIGNPYSALILHSVKPADYIYASVPAQLIAQLSHLEYKQILRENVALSCIVSHT